MKTCLIVVDYQNDFVDGALGFDGAADIEARIADTIDHVRKHGGDIVFTMDTHEDDYLDTEEGKNLPVKHCLKGTLGHRLRPAIEAKQRPEDTVLEKPSFPSIELADVLKRGNYDVVKLVGLVSNICVISNAIIAKAALPNAKIIVDVAAVASFDAGLHEKALDVMEGLHIHLENRG